ncbi:hypothetical protein PVAND_016722 [Polypedilum vanderplanki]|uniref:Lipase domain-containing protein n=1 Tax=Polypedilum vanderplanki TaxID=319348 RepID=A0A9J6BFZ5_POLVA|nr:hypothetical protein PVAND_016722 [Polypedilum vanderplanki]
MNNFIRQQLLDHADHNVVVVDWGAGAQTPKLSHVSAGLSGWNRINVIGHSLGGHVAGHTGKRTNGRIQAIFATDPAGPLFNINSPNDRFGSR